MTLTKFSIIVAVEPDNGIGNNNSIPWHSKEDLQFFKETTSNSVVIMGRKTFESLGGKILPNRVNIVVSNTMKNNEKYIVVKTLKEALSLELYKVLKKEVKVFIIGGERLYKEALEKYSELCNKVYITYIKTSYECDTFFPMELVNPVNRWITYDCDEYFREEIDIN